MFSLLLCIIYLPILLLFSVGVLYFFAFIISRLKKSKGVEFSIYIYPLIPFLIGFIFDLFSSFLEDFRNAIYEVLKAMFDFGWILSTIYLGYFIIKNRNDKVVFKKTLVSLIVFSIVGYLIWHFDISDDMISLVKEFEWRQDPIGRFFNGLFT